MAENLVEEFREEIERRLGARYYFDEAPDRAECPYRVGSFGPSMDDEIAEIMDFQLDYWDEGKTTRRIRKMIVDDTGNGNRFEASGLNGIKLNSRHGFVAMYKEREITVQDTDKGIRHIRVEYTARFYRTK
jgi:hypothetical protein